VWVWVWIHISAYTNAYMADAIRTKVARPDGHWW
jgi:hypothetical protein